MYPFHPIRKILVLFLLVTTLQQANGQTADDLYLQSMEYAEKGAYQQALLLLNRTLEKDSSKSDYYLQRAEIGYQLGNYDATIRDCYSALRLNPKEPRVYLLRGKVCVITESYGGAILFYSKCLDNSEDMDIRFEAFLNRGIVYNRMGKYYESQEDLKQAYTIDPNSLEVLLNLAETSLKLRNTNAAAELLEKALAAFPEEARVYDLLGRIAEARKDKEATVAAYEKLVELNPNNIATHNRLAFIYLEDKQYEKSLEKITSALSINPLDPQAYKIRGLVYFAQGSAEQGCNTLFRSMQLGYLEQYGYDLLDIYLEKCE